MNAEDLCGACGAPLPRGALGTLCARCLLACGLADPLVAEREAAETGAVNGGARLGDYELFEELGRGGMGVVYRARQIRLNRIVALKVLLAGSFASAESRQRFHREAEAAARLHHPNLVAIHEFGIADGRPYFSMDYVQGTDLGRLISDFGFRISDLRRSVRWVATIAAAVEYAHNQGILHRDLKPANVILDAEDQPHVTDFGLAREFDPGLSPADPDLRAPPGSGGLTLTGQALGSPHYMPPEQAAGRSSAVGPASDVYALGAILYQLLTGRPPFAADSVAGLLRQVQEQEPTAPRLLQPGLPRDLETICLKCLEKEPTRRFATARELAEELGRFLRGEPVRTRPVGATERLWRWARRNPRLATLSAGVTGLAAVILVGSPIALVSISRQRDRALDHAAAEERERQRAEATLRRLEIQQARQWFAGDQPAQAIALLAHRVRQNPSDRATAEWLMNELVHRSFALPALKPLAHDDRVFFAQFSPDGRRVLTVSRSNRAQLWDTASGEPLGTALQHDPTLVRSGEYLGPLRPLFGRFSPDGTRVVTASIDHTARVWDAETGIPITPPLPHPDKVWYAQFSPNGTVVATACEDGAVRLWDSRTGDPEPLTFAHEQAVNTVEFSPDGQLLISASKDATARVWDVDTGQRVGPALRHDREVRYAAFSPNGRQVVTISGDYTAQLWEVQSGQPLGPRLIHEGVVNTAQFSPDGTRLVTASFDKTARVWDVGTGRCIGRPLSHRHVVRSAAFSPEGTRIVTASEDRTARVWDADTGDPLTDPIHHAGVVWSATFHPDGQRVFTASSDGTAQIWHITPTAIAPSRFYAGNLVRRVEWSRDGQRLLTFTYPAAFVGIVTNGVIANAQRLEHPKPLTSAAISPDGRRAVTTSSDRTARLWNTETGQPITPPLEHDDTVRDARFSPDGHRLLTVSTDHTARLWNVDTGSALGPPLAHDDIVRSGEFSPDGQRIVTASADGHARIWDVSTLRRVAPPLKLPAGVSAAHFSPDGQSILTVCEDLTARLWDAVSGAPREVVIRHQAAINEAVFSPGGDRIATASQDHTARVWDPFTGRAVTEPLSHEAPVFTVQFSADGLRIVTASVDASARIWDARTGQPLSGPLRHSRALRDAAFSPNGRWIATAGTDCVACVWEFAVAPAAGPAWLADLAEAIAQIRFDTQRSAQAVPVGTVARMREHLAALPPTDPWVDWGRWLLAHPDCRPIAPSIAQRPYAIEDASVYNSHWSIDRTVTSDVRRLMQRYPTNAYFASALALAWHAELTNTVAHPHAGQAAPALVDPGVPRLPQLDWLTRRAIALGPDNAEAWWVRALYLDAAGDLPHALSVIETAATLGSQNMYVWRAKGELFEKAARLDDAEAAYARAVEIVETSPGFGQGEVEFFRTEFARFRERHPKY